jgi:hypothetical protein
MEGVTPGKVQLDIFIQLAMTGSPPPTNTAIAASTNGPPLDERERVVDLLQLRFADDHLSLDEFERRVAVAYQAKTAEELGTLVADLAPATAVSMVPEHGKLSAIFSSNDRDGAMLVPRQFEIVAVFGNVELDLSDATFTAGLTEIHVSAVLGNVELTLPLGIRVECSGGGLFGTFDCKAASITGYPADADRIVRITGRSLFASVEIGARPSTSTQMASGAPRRLT